jgi:DNA-binding HxlR family transcriptional regulator
MSRTYGQHCGLAAALDVVGDRWTMLLLRELFGGARRFRELARGLPGLSTALLSARLRDLERAGLVQRGGPGERGVAGGYLLTAEGARLGDALAALAAWGARRLPPAAGSEVATDPFWTLQTVAAATGPAGRARRSRVLNVEVDGVVQHVVLGHIAAAARRGAHPAAHGFLRTDHGTLDALRTGAVALSDAVADGRVAVEGDRALPARLFAPPDPASHPSTEVSA